MPALPYGDPALCLCPGGPRRRRPLPTTALVCGAVLFILVVASWVWADSTTLLIPQVGQPTHVDRVLTTLPMPSAAQHPLQPHFTVSQSGLLLPPQPLGWPGAGAVAAGRHSAHTLPPLRGVVWAAGLALGVAALALYGLLLRQRSAPLCWALVGATGTATAVEDPNDGYSEQHPSDVAGYRDERRWRNTFYAKGYDAQEGEATDGEDGTENTQEEEYEEEYPEETVESYAAKRRQVQGRAREVIRVVDPLWKLGYISDCERHLRKLYYQLLTEEEVTMDPSVYRILASCIHRLHPETGHRNCVVLRRGLEKVIAMPLEDPAWSQDPWQPQPAESLDTGTARVVRLFDFSTAKRARVITDRARYGDSLATLEHLPDKQCSMFEGVVGSGTGAPFTSIWLTPPRGDFSRYSGIYIDCCVPKEFQEVVFQVGAVSAGWWAKKVSITSGFHAPTKKFARVLIPHVYFGKPNRFGKPVKVPRMDWRQVERIGLLVMRPYIGPFRLYIRDMGLYR